MISSVAIVTARDASSRWDAGRIDLSRSCIEPTRSGSSDDDPAGQGGSKFSLPVALCPPTFTAAHIGVSVRDDFAERDARPPGVELKNDLEPSRWIASRLLPWDGQSGTCVANRVPTAYSAYIRILHPAGDRAHEEDRPVTWREISDWSGTTYHAAMQFPPDLQRPPTANRSAIYRRPICGRLEEGSLFGRIRSVVRLHDKYTLLARHLGGTRFWHYPASVSFIPDPGTDFGLSDLAARVRSSPMFEHPHRRYLLARSPWSSVVELCRVPLGITSNLVWPDNRTRCLATEIDLDSTRVACDEECAAALLADGRLEALRIQPNDRLDPDGDVLNR